MAVGERLALGPGRHEAAEIDRQRDEPALAVVVHRRAQLGQPARLAVRRQRHHLVLVGTAQEADVHRQLLVAQAQRVRDRDPAQHFELAVADHAAEVRGLLAAAVHHHHRAVAVRAGQVRRRGVRDVVRHVADFRAVQPRQQRRHETGRLAHEVGPQRFVLVVVQLGAVGQRQLGVVRVRDRVQLIGPYVGVPKRPARRLLRQFPGRERHARLAVLAPREPLFLSRGNGPAVDHKGRGRIVKHGVDTEYSHPQEPIPLGHKRGNPLTRGVSRRLRRLAFRHLLQLRLELEHLLAHLY